MIRAEQTAQELCRLLYDCGVSDVSLSLQNWYDMSVAQRLEQVVESKEESPVLEDTLRNRVLPMMYQDTTNTTPEWYDAVSKWLVKHVETRKGGLVQVTSIIVASRPTLPAKERLLRPISFLFRVALDCVYATRECDRDTLNAMNEIYKSLPGRSAASEINSELHDRVDEMDKHLGASERLSSYGKEFVRPPRWFLDHSQQQRVTTDDEKEEDISSKPKEPARSLIWSLCMKASRSTSLNSKDWKGLISDVLNIRSDAMSWVSTSFCYQILLQQILVAAQFDVAFEFLSEVSQHLDQDTIDRTVESAALEYFDSASGIEDQHAMDMCLKCLSMRPGAKFARSIRDLVEALRLLSAMGMKNRLPAEVRREKNKIEIIRWVFEVNSKAYKNLAANSNMDLPRPPGTTLFRLAQLLGLVSDVDRTRVRVLIAEYVKTHFSNTIFFFFKH